MKNGGIMKYGTIEKVKSGRKGDFRKKDLLIWIAMALIVVAATGCISKPSDINNKTVTMPVSTNTPVIPDVTPSIKPTGFLSSAPYQLYITSGQIYQFTYGGQNFTINYISAYPTQIVKITFDGHEKIIQKETYEAVSYLPSWIEGGYSFTLSPVSWEIRDGQRGPVYLSTWNATELYLEVLGED